MDFEFNRFSILYALGAILGIIAVIYFGQQLILDLSPTIKSFLLFALFLFFLTAGIYIKTKILDTVFYILSGGSYIIFLAYTIFKFNIGSNFTFLLLAFSSILFITLGYLLSEKNIEISLKQAKILLIGIIIISTGLIIFDVASPQPSHTLNLKENVDITVSDNEIDRTITVGNLTVKNSFLFSRNIDLPSYDACIYLPERGRTSIRIQNTRENIISGSTIKEYPIKVNLPPPRSLRREENQTIENYSGTFKIEKISDTNCPGQSTQKKIIITDSPRYID